MVCNERATIETIQRIDKKIAALHQRIATAPEPTIYAPEVVALVAEVDDKVRESVAHGGDHDSLWVDQGMPDSGKEYDDWKRSQDITDGWQRRRDALRELERRCRPKPKDPDQTATTPQEAFAVTGSAPKANAA